MTVLGNIKDLLENLEDNTKSRKDIGSKRTV